MRLWVFFLGLLLCWGNTSGDQGCLGKPWMPPPTSLHFAPDLTGDCRVRFEDLVIVLNFWGDCYDQAIACGCDPKTFCCRTDLNRDGDTDISDVVIVLTAMEMEYD